VALWAALAGGATVVLLLVFTTFLPSRVATAPEHTGVVVPQSAGEWYEVGKSWHVAALQSEESGDPAKARQSYEQAVGAYKRALWMQPDSADTHWNLALCLDALSRPEEAAWHWQWCAVNKGWRRSPSAARETVDRPSRH
jgi:hypothetical protein